MFNWLFKKYLAQITPEQQLAKEVEDVVQAMKESLGEAGRWEAHVRGVEETYKALYLALLVNDVVVKEHLVLTLTDTITGWEMSVKLKRPPYLNPSAELCEILDRKEKNVGMHRLQEDWEVDGVTVKNHRQYAYLPSQQQLKSIYSVWWQICILPE